MTDEPTGVADRDSGLRVRTDVKFVTPPKSDAAHPVAIRIKDANLFYGAKQALFDISLNIEDRMATAFIGPSGCGKSTLLRCLNRMNDLIDDVRITGSFEVQRQDIYARRTDVIEVRRKIGMVFQKSNPLPKSIYENVVYGLRIAGIRDKATLDEACERSLRAAALWDEVKDRLHETRPRTVGRPAAAALHRARNRHRARDPADGRAVLGARSDRDAEDRAADLRAEERLHHRDRDAQPAAGRARLGQDRVLLAGSTGRVQQHRRSVHRAT